MLHGKLEEYWTVGVCVCVFLFNDRELVPITRVPPIPCWDKGRYVCVCVYVCVDIRSGERRGMIT